MILIGICAFVAYVLWLAHNARTIIDGCDVDTLLAEETDRDH